MVARAGVHGGVTISSVTAADIATGKAHQQRAGRATFFAHIAGPGGYGRFTEMRTLIARDCGHRCYLLLQSLAPAVAEPLVKLRFPACSPLDTENGNCKRLSL